MTENKLEHEGAEGDVLDFDQLIAIQESYSILESAVDREFMTRFQPFFDSLNSSYFSATEITFLGVEHLGTGNCAGKNLYPTESLWDNLKILVPVLDAIRGELGEAITLNSVFRAPVYNSCIGGVVDSQHLELTAADCVAQSASSLELYQIAQHVRHQGIFAGGIGLYNSFVHIDVRGDNVDWSRVPT